MKKYLKYILFALMIVLCACAFGACAQNPQNEKEEREIQLSTPTNFQRKGDVLYWDEVEHADYYSVNCYDDSRTTEQNSYFLPTFSSAKTVTVRVRACSNNTLYHNSEWSEYSFEYEPATVALKYTLLEDKSGYEVARANRDPNKGLEGRVVIPDFYKGLPVKKIAYEAFCLHVLGATPTNNVTTSVRLPAYLETIGDFAFFCCEALEDIVIPETVTSIGESAFSCCLKLSKINIPSNITEITDSLFARTALTQIEIPQSVTHIGYGAFMNCDNLTEIVIPDSVTDIGMWAFYDSNNLASITMSKNLQRMDTYVFKNTAWYESQPDGFVTIGDIMYLYKGEMAEGTVLDEFPSEIKYIASGAFLGCKQLVSVDLSQVVLLGGYVFSGCNSLASVTLPPDITEIYENMFSNCSALTSFVVPEGIMRIGKSAFANCTSLTQITLPSTLEKIDSGAFSSCKQLTSVTIPEGVTVIGRNAFSGCTSLTQVTLPSTLKEISSHAFDSCTELTSVTIPEGVTVIGENAFQTCKKLTRIVLPSTLKGISTYAFYMCSNLTEIYYKGTQEEWDAVTIGNNNWTVTNANKYFYSESEPTSEGNYWHYVNGEVVVWTKE